MRAQLRCSPRTMFECIQSSRDTQPELVADNTARLSIDELSAVRKLSHLAMTRSVPRSRQGFTEPVQRQRSLYYPNSGLAG
jgi:hypothetical protein